MAWHPTKDAVQSLWGRRWLRRVTYAVVAGATVLTVTPWLATRPRFIRWIVGQLDAVVREETGLPLSIGHINLHPSRGSVQFHEVHLGGDLLTVKRADITIDLWSSLLGPTHHIVSVHLEQPHLLLTEAGLAAIKLRERPPRTGPLPQFRLDHFSLSGGEINVPVPVRGIPALRYQFEVKAVGMGPNHLRVNLAGTRLAVKGPSGWEKGRLDLHGEVSEPYAVIHEGYLRLGESQVRLNARYDAPTKKHSDQVEGRLTGLLNLAQASRWSGLAQPPLAGNMDLEATLKGSSAHPAWTLSADGQNLRPAHSEVVPGNLTLKGSGGLEQARLERLNWSSPQGDLNAQGSWSLRAPFQAAIQGTNLDLDALGRALRVPSLQGVRGTLQSEVHGPAVGDPLTRPDRWEGTLKINLTQNGTEAGGLTLSLDRDRATLARFNLDLKALKAEGTGWASLGPRGLIKLAGTGTAEVGVPQVAQALRAWRLVDLDMAGQAKAGAEVRWSRATGLELDGSCDIAQPRWQGAQADSLRSKVEIRGSDLRVKDIDLRKGEGRGGGDLWLTWGPTLAGQDQMDMCYTAFQLPIAEGLRAASLKDGDGHDLPMTGTASGWVRLRGPYRQIAMNGSAQVESAKAYGLNIPAAYSDFWMDLVDLRLKLSDVRIAERTDLLGRGEVPPEGALALAGQADMDFRRWTWWIDLGGRLDSQLLALPGPLIQAQAKVRLLGPITSPFGPIDLPEGRVDLTRGRVFFSDRSVEGLEATLETARGQLTGRLALAGMARPLLNFRVHQEGPDLAGDLTLNLSPETAPTKALAGVLTKDLLEDLSLDAKAQGRWEGNRGLTWSGTIDGLAAQFGAFELHQVGASSLRGSAAGAALDMSLEGGARRESDTKVMPQAALIRLAGNLPFSTSNPMALKVQGSADLAHMKTILDRVMEVDEYSLLSGLRVQGISRFDILAHGTYTDPLLDGTISLDQGEMHIRGYQGAEGIQAQLVLKDRTLTIPEDKPLRGTLAHGDLQVSGKLSWQLGGLEAYALKGSLVNFQLRDIPEGLDLEGTLQTTFEGDESGGVLKGKLFTDRVRYQTEIKLGDLILRSALSGTGGMSGLSLDDPLDRIRLDLDVELQNPWSIDTNLLKLDGRTEGPFQVFGTLAHPAPKGTLIFQPGGRVTNIFPAGDMVVDRGSLTFSESRPLDPVIALSGSVSSIPGYTVNLDIRGTLSNLNIVPSSTPTLRQDEIVAILTNPGNAPYVGTGAATSGATQAAVTSGLASASSGLITSLAFAPLQEQLRRTLGLDRVNVAVRNTSTGTSETEVTLGKSVSLLGQRSAFVVSNKKSGEVNITSGQVEWRFGNIILQLGASKGGSESVAPSGEIRHTWSPK